MAIAVAAIEVGTDTEADILAAHVATAAFQVGLVASAATQVAATAVITNRSARPRPVTKKKKAGK
jgi:hypothetical protein